MTDQIIEEMREKVRDIFEALKAKGFKPYIHPNGSVDEGMYSAVERFKQEVPTSSSRKRGRVVNALWRSGFLTTGAGKGDKAVLQACDSFVEWCKDEYNPAIKPAVKEEPEEPIGSLRFRGAF